MRCLRPLWFLAAAIVFVLVAPALVAAERSGPEKAPPKPGAKPEGPPKPMVLRFTHIPAQSFMETLHQLGRNDRLGEALREMPIALNEPANAVVVLCPPPMGEFLAAIAKGLDQPNEFEMAMRKRGREEMEFHLKSEEAKRRLGVQPGQPRPPAGDGPLPPAGPADRGPPPKAGPQGRGPVPPGRPGQMGPPPWAGVWRRDGPQRFGPPAGRPPLSRPGDAWPPPMARRGEGPAGRSWLRDMGRGLMRRPAEVGPRPEPRLPEGGPPGAPPDLAERERPLRDQIRSRLREHQPMPPAEREHMDRRPPEGQRADRERARPERMRDEQPDRQGPERDRRERDDRGPADWPEGDPIAGMGAFTSPRVIEMLRLTEEQVRRIREALEEVRRGIGQMMSRVHEAARSASPEERSRRMREMMERARAGREERLRDLRERIASILTPEQREKARELLSGRRGGPPDEPRREGPPPGRPPEGGPQDRPPPDRPRREGPAAPAVEKNPAEFRLIQDAGPPGDGRRGRPGGEGRDVDPAERQKMIERARTNNLYRLLEDADICASLGLSAEQESKIADCQAKIKKMRSRIEDQARLQGGAEGGDDSGDQRARQRDVGRVLGQAYRGAQDQFDALMKQAVEVLTQEQRAKLEELGRQRARYVSSSGNLWVLLTRRARDEVGLSDEQVLKIRKILDEAADRMDEQRRAAFAQAQDVPQAERGEAMRARMQAFFQQRQESLDKTRENVFALLTDEQKPKAEKLMAEAAKSAPAGPMRFMGGWPGGQGGFRPGASAAPARQSVRPAVLEQPPVFYLVGEGAAERPARRQADRKELKRPQGGPVVPVLRLLEDPDVRKELGMSADQETKVMALVEKARQLRSRLREEAEVKLSGQHGGPQNEEKRRERKREISQTLEEAMRARQPEFEAIAREVMDLLTEEQRRTLFDIGQARLRRQMVFAGLDLLVSPEGKEQLGLTAEQVEKIQAILKDLEDSARRAHKDAGNQEPLPEARQEAIARRGEKIRTARRQIMEILTPEQRQKAERLLMERAAPPPPPRTREAPSATRGYGDAA